MNKMLQGFPADVKIKEVKRGHQTDYVAYSLTPAGFAYEQKRNRVISKKFGYLIPNGVVNEVADDMLRCELTIEWELID